VALLVKQIQRKKKGNWKKKKGDWKKKIEKGRNR
jgi:hypothetical protein